MPAPKQAQPDPRIAEYIAEIERPGVPYVNTSHVTLYRICREHGTDTVEKLIDDYFAQARG